MTDKPQGIFKGYSEEHVPLRSYTALIGAFNMILVGVLLAAKGMRRPGLASVRLADILLLGVATHKLSWLISRDAVLSPVRAPFTTLQKVKSPSEVKEQPRERGLRRALGELLTCEFCVGQWVAAFFSYGLLFAPVVTRFVAAIFVILSVADHLHQIYRALVKRA